MGCCLAVYAHTCTGTCVVAICEASVLEEAMSQRLLFTITLMSHAWSGGNEPGVGGVMRVVGFPLSSQKKELGSLQ